MPKLRHTDRRPPKLATPLVTLAVVIAIAVAIYLYANSGTQYGDPAGRFSLRLPRGWTVLEYRPHDTYFTNPQGQIVRFASYEANSKDLLQAVDKLFNSSDTQFDIVIPPEPAVMGDAPAVYTEYRYRNANHDAMVREAAYFTLQSDRLHGLVVGAEDESDFDVYRPLLRNFARRYASGPHPEGYVPAETLADSATRHLSFEGHFDMEISELWPVVSIPDDPKSVESGLLVEFNEIGGNGFARIDRIQIPPSVKTEDVARAWLNSILESSGTTFTVLQERNRKLIDYFGTESFLVQGIIDDESFYFYGTVLVAGAHTYLVQILYPEEGFYARRDIFDQWLNSIHIPRTNTTRTH